MKTVTQSCATFTISWSCSSQFLLCRVLFQAGTIIQIKTPPPQKLILLSVSLFLSINPSGPSPLYHLVPTGQGEEPHLLQPGSPGIELLYPKEMTDIT